MLCFEEAVYATWPIVIAPKGGPAAEAGPAELTWKLQVGREEVQPCPGSNSKEGGGLRPSASEDKGMQSCDWRDAFDDTHGATFNNHCTSPLTKYSKLLQITMFNFPFKYEVAKLILLMLR